MDFGPIPLDLAEGATLAHSARLESKTFKKGHLLTAEDLELFRAAGWDQVTVARLDGDDIGEDTAADRIALAAAGPGIDLAPPFTGRVNLHAAHAGVLMIDKRAVDAANRIDPAVTFATLPAFETVEAGRMIATAKIIPYGVPGAHVAAAERALRRCITVRPYRARRIGLVSTQLPHLKPATMDKTRRVLERRLAGTGSEILDEIRTGHSAGEVAAALKLLKTKGADFFILFGASAVVDRRDVLPSGIEAAGGRVHHFGMPVDPGNLLMIGEFAGCPVIGAPGCARSPKENGFDWVLARLLAEIEVTRDDITSMGVGGLLMEIASRPQPREKTMHPENPKIAAIVLAAGKSSRMGGPNKLLARLDGEPLVTKTTRAAAEAGLTDVVVVTGHMKDGIEAALAGLPVAFVHNPDYAEGMSGSIRAGLEVLDDDTDAAIVLLADMPEISTTRIQALIDMYSPDNQRMIIMATADGKRGNPVLWDRRFFPELKSLAGDIGARHLITENPGVVAEVELGGAARLDLDTPEAMRLAGAEIVEE